MSKLEETTERRRHQRLELEVEVTVRTDSALLPGRTVDISESGVSVILPIELHVGEIVELVIKLPNAPAGTRAIVRRRNVFRHGFEFVQPLHEIVGKGIVTGDCQSCAGTGSILSLDREQGVAFARVRCGDCSGTGRTSKQAI